MGIGRAHHTLTTHHPVFHHSKPVIAAHLSYRHLANKAVCPESLPLRQVRKGYWTREGRAWAMRRIRQAQEAGIARGKEAGSKKE